MDVGVGPGGLPVRPVLAGMSDFLSVALGRFGSGEHSPLTQRPARQRYSTASPTSAISTSDVTPLAAQVPRTAMTESLPACGFGTARPGRAWIPRPSNDCICTTSANCCRAARCAPAAVRRQCPPVADELFLQWHSPRQEHIAVERGTSPASPTGIACSEYLLSDFAGIDMPAFVWNGLASWGAMTLTELTRLLAP